MTNKSNLIFCTLLCILSITLDQASKWYMLAFIPINYSVAIFPWFNFVLYLNYGTSFGLLSPSNLFEFYSIITVSIFCIILLIYAFIKFNDPIEKISLSILIGGAIGNVIDRFIHGAVVDFIDLHYGELHWPAFNLADAFILCSTIYLILYNIFKSK